MPERTVSHAAVGRKIHAVTPQCTSYHAACVMTRARCGCVLVIDSRGTLQGIFTERDLMVNVVAEGLDPRATLIADVMTPQPRTVRPDTPVSDAVMIMKDGGFRHLPVVTASNHILGVFSLRDAMPDEIASAHRYEEQLEDEFANVPA